MATPRKIRCQVKQVIPHGDRVYTVDLQPEQTLPLFRPGQFMHLTLEAYDPSGFWPESRVFSIASSPTQRQCLRISYAVKGAYTARMEETLCPGLPVWVKLPYGSFVVEEGADAVLIAGGTGITAFQGFIAQLTPAHAHQVVLLLGARRKDLLLGLDALEAQRRQVPRFQAFYFSEDLTATAEGIRPGRIRLDVLHDGISPASPVVCVAPAKKAMACEAVAKQTLYYLAGPPAMLTAYTTELAKRGVPTEQIRVDAWE